MRFHKRVWLLCTAAASLAMLSAGIFLHFRDPEDPAAHREQMMRMSPATRIEYRRDGAIRSCVEWGHNSLLSAVFSREQMAAQNLREAGEEIDTSGWIIRVTFHIDEVSVNVPEIVCLVGEGWESVDGAVYEFPDAASSQQWVAWLTDYFYDAVALNGEEALRGNPVCFGCNLPAGVLPLRARSRSARRFPEGFALGNCRIWPPAPC